VAEVLELAELPEHDGVAEVDVRRGGVEADLHGQPPVSDPPRELRLLDQVDSAPAQAFELRGRRSHGGTE